MSFTVNMFTQDEVSIAAAPALSGDGFAEQRAALVGAFDATFPTGLLLRGAMLRQEVILFMFQMMFLTKYGE